jgi:hypothetical protein
LQFLFGQIGVDVCGFNKELMLIIERVMLIIGLIVIMYLAIVIVMVMVMVLVILIVHQQSIYFLIKLHVEFGSCETGIPE